MKYVFNGPDVTACSLMLLLLLLLRMLSQILAAMLGESRSEKMFVCDFKIFSSGSLYSW